LGTNASCLGTFNVERFFQGGTAQDATGRYKERNYRIISSPVNAGTSTDGNSNLIVDLKYIAGGTGVSSATTAIVTGATGGTTSAGNPTLYLYRENKVPSNSSFT